MGRRSAYPDTLADRQVVSPTSRTPGDRLEGSLAPVGIHRDIKYSEPDDHGEPECDRETERERRESGWQNSTDLQTATASVMNGQAHATRS